jgi:Winged helix-turn-helix domain (DUF2582)
MGDEIGTMAGVIWTVLNSKDELSLVQLKKEVRGKSPLFDWAIGWLAREDKIVITPGKRTFRVRLKKEQGQAASAY